MWPAGVNAGASNRGRLAALLAILLVAVIGVGALGAGVAVWVQNLPSWGELDGYASLGMPLTGADVAVYEMNATGQPGALL